MEIDEKLVAEVPQPELVLAEAPADTAAEADAPAQGLRLVRLFTQMYYYL